MPTINQRAAAAAVAALFAALAPETRADAVTDWNARAGALMGEAKLGTPPAIRAMALVQTAVNEAVQQAATQGGSAEAAVAAANRAVLAKLLPAHQAAIDAAFHTAMARVDDGTAKAAGIAAGEQAASAVLARRAGDMPGGADEYRPHTSPGAYVPTAAPAGPSWGRRKPWLLASADQFRPAAPLALSSADWARDYNEVKALGAKASPMRTPEQTEIARFWEYSLPPIYFGVARSIADRPDRDLARNARLFAAVAQAMDDALIGVFEAKYHHNFWRPATAIRNGDLDGNDATMRDPSWAPLVEAPMHPEYPSAHSTLAAAVGTVIKAEVGAAPMPVLATSSPTAQGATRRWNSAEEFIREVADARIYAGIHYRAATQAGIDLGTRIGALAATRHFN